MVYCHLIETYLAIGRVLDASDQELKLALRVQRSHDDRIFAGKRQQVIKTTKYGCSAYIPSGNDVRVEQVAVVDGYEKS